jgi:DNA-directed RNA polymerase subunit beta
MDEQAIELFKQMTQAINEAVGTRDGRPDDPPEGRRVGHPEVILEQIKTFDIKWIKGSKETKDEAEKVHRQFWPRIEAIEAEKQRKVAT